jgi:lauroyl/myristoyl acyltransferase
VRGFFVYSLYRLLGALLGPMPPRVGYWVARRGGSLLYRFSPRLRRILTHNMRHVLGPDADETEVQRRVRQACVNIAKGHYELFRVSRLSIDEIRAMTRLEGRSHVEEALARGKGVILLSAHFGSVDLLGQLPVAYGVPLTAPIQHVQPERLFQYTLRLRTSHGVRLIPADGPLMEMFRALRRGEVVALPCDRDIADNTRWVDLFGEPARLSDGPVRVALRTGAALIPIFGLRLPDDTFLVRIEPELELSRSGDLEADVEAGMAQIAAMLEKIISTQPEQWLVATSVWPLD